MKKLKKILPIALFFLLPMYGMDFGGHLFLLVTPVVLLSWGFLLCPFYTAVCSLVYGHRTISTTFLFRGSMLMTSKFPSASSLLPFTIIYENFLWVFYTSVIVVIVVLLIKNRMRAAAICRDLTLALFLPYLIFSAVLGGVSLSGRLYLILIALLIATYLSMTIFEAMKKRRAK